MVRSAPGLVQTVVPWTAGKLLALSLDGGPQLVEVLCPTAGVNVDVLDAHVENAAAALPHDVDGKHGDKTEEIQVDLEEVDNIDAACAAGAGSGASGIGRPESAGKEPRPDFEDQDHDVKHDPPPTTVDSTHGCKDQLACVASACLQGLSEADVN